MKQVRRTKFPRRNFLLLIGTGFSMLLFAWRTFGPKIGALQTQLLELGFEVDKDELQKFWKAWRRHLWTDGEHVWKYYPWLLLQYPKEPTGDTLRIFLLSSNALTRQRNEKIRFEVLYSPYTRPCFHPFLLQA